MANLNQFSVYLYGWGKRPPTIKDLMGITRRLDRLGYYSIGFPHHMALPPAPLFDDFGNRYLLDPLPVLPALAAVTRNIRLGIHSLILPLYPPYHWAKTLATLDVISGGRLIPGMCMGWNEADFRVMGADHKHRARITDEQLEVITRLWTEDEVTFKGRFYDLEKVTLEPKPVQKPYPPIWYGGGLPSIPRAVKYAKYILPAPMPAQEIEKEWRAPLKKANEESGSSTGLSLLNFVAVVDDESKVKTQVVPRLEKCMRLTATGVRPEEMAIVGTPETCAQRVREFQEAGVSHFLLDFNFRGTASFGYLRRQVDLFAERVVPLI